MVKQAPLYSDARYHAEPTGSVTIDFEMLLAGARRQRRLILAGLVAGLVAAVIYLGLATKQYTASADILIDGRQLITTTRTPEDAQLIFATGAIESQVEVVKSQQVIEIVIAKLKLTEDPEFTGSSMLGSLMSRVLGSEETQREREELVRKVREAMMRRLQVTRVNKTFVFSVDFTSRDPVKAAQIANGIADAYLFDQLNSKYEASKRASAWLQDRIVELREQTRVADNAVQEFREKNGLILTGGRLINDQALQEIGSQITLAQAQRAQAGARFEQLNRIIQTRQLDASVTEALQSPVINDLRTKYLNASKRVTELMERVGAGHQQFVLATRERRDYENLLFEELGRIAEAQGSQVKIEAERERSLNQERERLIAANASDNLGQVRLRELERDSESFRVLFQSFLQRNQELIQQQSYPVTDARVITRAARPSSASSPRPAIALGIGLVGGFAFGVGMAMLREYRDRTFRVGNDVREHLNMEFFGFVPTIAPERLLASPRALPSMRSSIGLFSAAVEPLSAHADTMRTAKVAIDADAGRGRGRIIGIVSLASGEGKTLNASNLAMLLGNTGARTLLIDADLRRCSLSRELGAGIRQGIVDVVERRAALADVVVPIAKTNVWLLGSPPNTRLANSSELLQSDAVRRMFEQAAREFDYLVVDLPPLGALVDARAIEPLIDRFMLVIEWGVTQRDNVLDMLEASPAIRDKCIGAVLNKAEPHALHGYVKDTRNYYIQQSY